MIESKIALDKVCDIANTFQISPISVLKLYNKSVMKHYIDDNEQAIKLIQRYIEIKYPYRNNYARWDHIETVNFFKKKYTNED